MLLPFFTKSSHLVKFYGNVHGEVHLPRVYVKVKGNVKFHCRGTFGSIIGDGPCNLTIG